METLQRWMSSEAWMLTVIPLIPLLATAFLSFRLTWKRDSPRSHQITAMLAVGLFLFSPVTLYAAAVPEPKLKLLLIPFLLILFFTAMQGMENWSTFMRSIVLAGVWSLFLWIDGLTAFLLLLAMIPWILCTRRPLLAVGTFLTLAFLGPVFFSLMYISGCILFHQGPALHVPLVCIVNLVSYFQAMLSTIRDPSWTLQSIWTRFSFVLGIVSPYGMALGFWILGRRVPGMVTERRAGVVELEILVSLVLGMVYCSTSHPGVSRVLGLLPILCLWVPLVGKDLARQDAFQNKTYRKIAIVGLMLAAVNVWAFWKAAVPLTSRIGISFEVGLGLVVGGGLWMLGWAGALSKRRVIQAFLIGSACGYTLMVDGLGCRGLGLF